MKFKIDFKKTIIVVLLLVFFTTILTACNQNAEVFNPPAENIGDDESNYSKTNIEGTKATKLISDSIKRARAQNGMDASVLNFEFSTYLDFSEIYYDKKFEIEFKGSIDYEDSSNNLLSIELKKFETGVDGKILGVYANENEIFIDLRQLMTSEGIHVYRIEDMNLSWLVSVIQTASDNLDAYGLISEFKINDLLEQLDIDLSDFEILLPYLKGNLLEVLGHLASTCTMMEKDDGTVFIDISTILNNSAFYGLILSFVSSAISEDVNEISELVFGVNISEVLNKCFPDSDDNITPVLKVRASIQNNLFKHMSVGFDIKKENPTNIDLGVKNIQLGKKPTFSLPDFTDVETERYSLTTLSADVDLQINAKEHTYTINSIDSAIGNLISKILLESGKDYKLVDSLGSKTINTGDLIFNLHLKLRAEINMLDNSKSKILLELYDGQNLELYDGQNLRAGIYYLGSEEALYIDLSGMRSGRYKIDSYFREIAEVSKSGDYVKDKETGDWVLYDDEKHRNLTRYDVKWVSEPLNIAKILKDSINNFVQDIPSLKSIINDALAGATSASVSEEQAAINELLQSGEVMIMRYPKLGDATAQAESEIDTMALIKKILLCTELTKGDTKLSFDKIFISLTDDVIQTIAGAIKPGLELPITKLDIEVISEGIGFENLIIDLTLGDRKATSSTERELLGINLNLGLDYGNPKNDFTMPDVNNPALNYILLPLSKNKDGTTAGVNELNLQVDGKFRMQANQATWDLSPLEKLLYGLILQIEVQDELDINYGYSIKANLDLDKIKDGDILGAIEARVDLTKNPDDINVTPTIMIYIVDGKLYLNAQKAGLPLMMIDIKAIQGDAEPQNINNAIATADETEEKSDIDVLGVVVGILGGVYIDSNAIEVKLVENFLGSIISILKPEFADEDFIKELPVLTDESGIKITFDGLNLSELYIDANLGLEHDDGRFDLGFGLGHILLGLNKANLAPNNLNDYVDVVSELNIYLGLKGQISFDLKQGEIDINNMIGALLVDMASGAKFEPKIDIEEDILNGVNLDVKMSLDLKNEPEFNSTQIAIKIESINTGMLLLGIYYDNQKLYVDGSALGIDEFYINIDLVGYIKQLINNGEEPQPTPERNAYSTEGNGEISLEGLNCLLILSDSKIQTKVVSGLTGLIVGIICDNYVGGDNGNEWMREILENEGMEGFDLPEIGASITIDFGKDKDKPFFNALSLGVDITLAKDIDSDPTLTLSASLDSFVLDVKLHDIINESNVSKQKYVGVDLLNKGLNNLYFQTVGSINLGAEEGNPSYCLGDYLGQFADKLKSQQVVDENGNPIIMRDENGEIIYETDENGELILDKNGQAIPVYLKDIAGINGLFDYLCRIMIKFGVVNDLHKVIGFRIAANLAINTLMGDDGADIVALLENSEASIEFYNGEYENEDKVIGLYLKSGTLYIDLDGKLISQSKLKINLITSGILDDLIKSNENKNNALATADEETKGLIPSNIVDVLNSALKSIGINNDGISVNLGANLLGAVLGLVVGGSGYTMPQLNEDNSYLRWNTGDKELSLCVGIDPVYFGLNLGGFEFGFNKKQVVTVPDEELEDYMSIADLTTLSLKSEITLDVDLSEGVIPVGDTVSKILQSLGKELDFEADMDILNDLALNLRVYLKANLNILEPETTEVLLEIFNEPSADEKTKILGIYLDGETLYIDPGILNMAKVKVTDFTILTDLLSDVFADLSSALQGMGGNGTAMATASEITDDELLDVLFALSEDNIKIILTERLIIGLLEVVAPDIFTPELSDALDDLNLNAGIEINTDPIEIGVFVNTTYLALGVYIKEPQLSIKPIDNLFDTVLTNKEQYINYRDYNNLHVELDMAVRYKLSEGKHDMSSLIDDLLNLQAVKDNPTLSEILSKIMLNLILTDNKVGQIDIKFMANIDTEALFNAISNNEEIDIEKILELLDASIILQLGDKSAIIAISQGNLYIKLDDVGGPNFKIENLADFISSISTDNAQTATYSKNALSTDEENFDLINTIINNAISSISLGKEHGLDIALAPQILAVVMGTLLKDTIVFSEETLSNFYLADERTDDTVYKLATDAEPEEIMDIRDYVFIDGEYVLFDEENLAHISLPKYKKVRHSGITFKVNDCMYNGNISFNVDLAFKNGFDAGVSIYDYSAGVEKIFVDTEEMQNYPSITNLMTERIFVSTRFYLELSSTDDKCYDISDVIDAIVTKLDVDIDLSGLANLLTVLELKEFNNRLDIQISADLILDDIINKNKFDTLNIAIEFLEVSENGETRVRGGIYLANGSLYIDLSDYNGTPIIAIPNAISIIGDLIDNLSAKNAKNINAENAALSTNGNELAKAEKGALDILIGSKGFKLNVSTELVTVLLETLLDVDIDLGAVFDEFNASIGFDWENAEGIQDISFDVDVNIGKLNIGAGLYNLQLEFNTEKDLIPEKVITECVYLEDLILNFQTKLYFGIDMEKSSIDIGGLLRKYIPDLSLMLNVPNEDGARVGIILDIACNLDLNNFANTEARIHLLGVAGVDSEPKLLGSVWYKNGEICIDLSNLGIDKIKITGLNLNEILGDSLLDVLNGNNAQVTSGDDIDPRLASILVTFDGESIAINLGKELFSWILKLDALSDVTKYLPEDLDISALLDIQYINPETGDYDLSINLNAFIAKILGIKFSIYDFDLGFTNEQLFDLDSSDYTEVLELGMVEKFDEDGNPLKNPDGTSQMGLGIKEIKLETVSLNLSISLVTLMQGDENGELDFESLIRPFFPDAEDLYAIFNIPNPVKHNLYINFDVEAQIMKIIEIMGEENIDIGELLKAINANIEIIERRDNGFEKIFLGIYLNNGDAYLRLDGLGFPNVRLENEFIMEIINAVSSEQEINQNALATDVDTSKISGVIGKLVNGITLANKAMTIVINDNYLQALISMVFPELEIEVPSFSADINALTLNLNRGYYVLENEATNREKSYVDNYGVIGEYEQYVKVENEYIKLTEENEENYIGLERYLYIVRDGLIELDLTFFESKLNVDVLPPHVGFIGGQLQLPDIKWENASEINAISLSLRGNLGVETAERKAIGIGDDGEDIFETTVGDVLGGLVGDLSAGALLDEFSINLNYEITAALSFDYNIAEKKFEIKNLDFAINILRVKTGGITSKVISIYYSNTDGKIYVDLSHFGVENIAITGIKLTDLLSKSNTETTKAITNALSTSKDAEYGINDNDINPNAMTAIFAEMGYNHLLVSFSSKIVDSIIGILAKDSDKNIVGILPNLGLKVEINTNPFDLALCVQLQDNNYEKVANFNFGLKGFDYTDGTGSELAFEYFDVFGENFPYASYKEAVKLNLDAEDGESIFESTSDVLNLSFKLQINFEANMTEEGEEYNWTKYFSELFGLTEDELKVLIGIYEKQSNTLITLDVDAALNLSNLLGPTLSLAGSEIKFTLEFRSDELSQELYEGDTPAKMVVTIVGEDIDGNTGVYLDLSGYRNKGKHKLSIDLMGLLSKNIKPNAMATENKETGLLDRETFNILDSILGSLKFSDGRISLNVKRSFLTAIFDLALIDNPYLNSLDMPPVEGGVYIDITNLAVGLNLTFEKAMSIGIKVSDIEVKEQNEWKENGTFRPTDADTEAWSDMRKMKLNVDLLGELTYKAYRTTTSNPAINLNELFSLIKIDGVPLLQNPIFQLRVAKDMGTTYIVNTHVYLDLEDFNNLKISLEVYDIFGENSKELMIGVYLDGENAYLDLSSLGLPHIAIGGINVGDILEDSLGEFLGHEDKYSQNAQVTALGTDADLMGDIILNGKNYAYMAMVFQPELFAIGLNAKFIDAVINVVKKAQGEDVSSDSKNIPDFGDLAVIADSTTKYILESEANDAVKDNIRFRYVKDGESYFLLSKDNKDKYSDTEMYPRYIKVGGKLLPELAVRISDGFYGSIKLNDIHINANLDNPLDCGWETVNEVFDRISRYEGDDSFIEVYNLQTKEIGLGKVNFGMNINVQFISQHSVLGDDNYGDSFQFYFANLLASLLGGDAKDYRLNLPDNIIQHQLALKLTANVSEIYNTDTGLDIAALLNSELFIEMKIGAPYNKLLIGLYKQENDNAVYVDLSGLGLPKVKLIGLGSLLSGIGTAVAEAITGNGSQNALASGDISVPPAFAEVAIQDGRVEISLEMEVIRQVLIALGKEIGTKTYTITDGGKSASADYATLTMRNPDGTVSNIIPLPNLDILRLSVDMEKKINSIGLNIGLDDIGNALSVTLDNFDLLTGDIDYISDSDFTVINDNPEEWGSLILTDIYGVSMGNIVKGVMDSIDPNISIQLNKKVSSKQSPNSGANQKYSPNYTNISITRTKGDETNSDNDAVYGGKIAVNLDINTSGTNRHAAVWLFNNQLYGDFGEIAGALSGFVDLFMDLRKMKLADLNIVDLVTEGASASEKNKNALITEDAEESNILDTVKEIIKGIKIDWWYNVSVSGTLGDMRYSTIRLDLKPRLINNLLCDLYYMLFTMQYTITEKEVPSEYISLEEFKTLDYEQKHAIVTEWGDININGKTYKKVDCYKASPYYIRFMLGNKIEQLTGSSFVGDLVRTGTLVDIDGILFDLIGGLLPIPLLDESRPNYIEIVFDKLGENGIISEIGFYINKEKSNINGESISRINVNSSDENAELIIHVNKLYTLSVSSVDWYNDSEKAFGEMLGIDLEDSENSIISHEYIVNDPFNPIELGYKALNSPTTLPQRVDATFTGVGNYTSKGHNGQNKDDAWVELGGTSIIWDVSQVNLTPGSSDSYIYGYALNKLIAKIPVIVGNSAAYMGLYGYIDSNGDFIKTNSLTIDPMKSVNGSLTELPKAIAIKQNNGNIQLLSTEFIPPEISKEDGSIIKQAEPSAIIDGKKVYADGKFGWIEPEENETNFGGLHDVSFWYKVNNSAKITVSTKVNYINRDAMQAMLPVGTDEQKAKFKILSDGDALNFTAESVDIVKNISELKEINVRYSNGEVDTLNVIEWQFSDLEYDINTPYKGAKGSITAVVGKKDVYTQKLRIPISIKSRVVDGIDEDLVLKYNPYTPFASEILLPEGELNIRFNLSRIKKENKAVKVRLSSYNDGRIILEKPSNIRYDKGGKVYVYAIIGNEITGIQTIKIPVEIETKIIKSINYTIEDPFDTNALAKLKGQSVTVFFNDGSSMKLIIKDEVKLLNDERFTNNGGSYKAEIVVGNEYAGVENNQKVTANINVMRKAIVDGSVKFFSNGNEDDLNNYNLNVINIDPDYFDFTKTERVKITYKNVLNEEIQQIVNAKWADDTADRLRQQVTENAVDANENGNIKLGLVIGSQTIEIDANVKNRYIESNLFEGIDDYTIYIENIVSPFELPTQSTVVFQDGINETREIVWSDPVFDLNPDGSLNYNIRNYTAKIIGVNFERILPNKIKVEVIPNNDNMQGLQAKSACVCSENIPLENTFDFGVMDESNNDEEPTPNIEKIIINPYQYKNYEEFKQANKTIKFYDKYVKVVWPEECFYALEDGKFGYLGGEGVAQDVKIIENHMTVNVPFEIVPTLFGADDLVNSGDNLVNSVLTTNYFEMQSYPQTVSINGYEVLADWSNVPKLTINGYFGDVVIKVGNSEVGWQDIKVKLKIADKSIAYIVNGAYASIIFDPLYNNEINYPKQIEVKLNDGTFTTMDVEIPEDAISFETEINQTEFMISKNLKYSGIKKVGFEFFSNGIGQVFEIPIEIIDRKIISDTLPAQIVITNPFMFNTNPYSDDFSFPKTTEATFADGTIQTMDVKWTGLFADINANDGSKFTVTVEYGSDLTNISRKIECSVNKISLSTSSLVEDNGEIMNLQDLIDKKLNQFEAYPNKAIDAQNAKSYSNYFNSANFKIGENFVKLNIKWQLATLNYDYHGGAEGIIVEIGNDIGGYQRLKIFVNIKPWVISEVNFDSLNNIIGQNDPLDPFANKAEIFRQIENQTYTVKFENGETKNVKANWNFKAVKPTLDGGIFNAVATFFEEEYAGKQFKYLPFRFFKRSIISVTTEDKQLLADTEKINPYNNKVELPENVIFYFRNTIDGKILNTDSITFRENENLSWNKANFRPNYNGEICLIESRVSYNDVTFVYNIYYEVYALMASKIINWGDKYKNVNWTISEDGYIEFDWEIDPLKAVKSEYYPSNTNIGVEFDIYDYGKTIVGKWCYGNRIFDIKGDNTYLYYENAELKLNGNWYVEDNQYKFTYQSGSTTKVGILPFKAHSESYKFNTHNFIHNVYGMDFYGTYRIENNKYYLMYTGTTKEIESDFTTTDVIDSKFSDIKYIDTVMRINLLDNNFIFTKQPIKTNEKLNYNFSYVDLSMPAAYDVSIKGGKYEAGIRLGVGDGENLQMNINILNREFTVDSEYQNMEKFGNSPSDEAAKVEEKVPVTFKDGSKGYLNVYWEYKQYYSNTITYDGEDIIKRNVYDDNGEALTYEKNEELIGIIRNVKYSYNILKENKATHYNKNATESSKFVVGDGKSQAYYEMKGYVGRVYDSDGESVALDTGVFVYCNVTIGGYEHKLDQFDVNGVWESEDGTYTCIAFDKNNSHTMRVVSGCSYGAEPLHGNQTTKETTFNYNSETDTYSFGIDGVTYYAEIIENFGTTYLSVTMAVTPNGNISYSDNNILFKKVNR